jgi:hypothetical protein
MTDSPLDFLRSIYMDEEVPLPTRIKAATEAAQYVHPRLAMVGVAHAREDFGVMLERAIAASTKAKESPKMIEAQAKPNGHSLSPTDVSSLRRRRA